MALLFTFLCGSVAITLGYFINYFAKGYFVHGAQAIIDSEVKYLDARGSIPDETYEDNRIYVSLTESGQLPALFQEPENILTEGLLVFEVKDRKESYAARVHTMKDGTKVLVGVEITDMAKDYDFMQLIGVASIIFVMLVVFVSYGISVFVVKGTNSIANTAYEIMRTGDLSRRVDLGSRWDDLGNMANVLNLLFDRVEQLMMGIRHVSDNIAHDLRTPLTRMRNRIENLKRDVKSPEEYEELLNEADSILDTFNALLRISRLENEQQRSKFERLSLDQIIQDVVEFYEPLAWEKQIEVHYKKCACYVDGDRNLLFQLFANIMDNAIKYTNKGKEVWVNLSCDYNVTLVSIENIAEPLPEDDLKCLFDRFYRVDKSRSKNGSGLGLSLVAAIIKMHGGTVRAENTNRGIVIITRL